LNKFYGKKTWLLKKISMLQIFNLSKKRNPPEAGAGAAIQIDGAERIIFGSATLVLGMLHIHNVFRVPINQLYVPY
jgi:hypothetical protein